MSPILSRVLVVAALAASLGCHPGPVVGATKTSVGGTISGNVTAVGGVALAGRKVTAVDVKTNARYDATTTADGGYTMKVPEGTYRLDVELHSGESLQKRPSETKINNSDLDSGRDFVLTAAR